VGLLSAARMWRFWQFRGPLDEGRRWLENLLAVQTEAVGVARVKALIGLAGICYWQGDLDATESRYREALKLVEILGDRWLEAEALSGLAITLACHRRDVEAAAPPEWRLCTLAEEHQDPNGHRHECDDVGGHAGDGGGPGRGSPLLRAGAGDVPVRRAAVVGGQTLRLLGLISAQERYEEAENELRGSLEIAWEAGATFRAWRRTSRRWEWLPWPQDRWSEA